MEERLINFETSKLAKEKEFDILCEHSFSEHDSGIQENNQNGFRNWNKEYKNSYSRPSQSLLQKWLREVHKINVESNYLPNVEKYRYLFIPMTLKKPSEYSTPGTAFASRFNYLDKENYNTYEEALEIGLYQALLLI